MASYMFNSFLRNMCVGTYKLDDVDNTFSISLVNKNALKFSWAWSDYYGVLWDRQSLGGWAYLGALSGSCDIKTNQYNEATHEWIIYNSEGYEPKGLSGCQVTASVDNKYIEWNVDDVEWTDCTIDADGFIVYQTATGWPICTVDFGGTRRSDNGYFKIHMDTPLVRFTQ